MKTLDWKRKLDGHHNGRPLYDYSCKLGSVEFNIVRSTDAGFGLTVFDVANKKYLSKGYGINWLRSMKRCKAEAERIALANKLLEDANDTPSSNAA